MTKVIYSDRNTFLSQYSQPAGEHHGWLVAASPPPLLPCKQYLRTVKKKKLYLSFCAVTVKLCDVKRHQLYGDHTLHS